MENKINIVELLKKCPTGMELDCTMYNKVTLLNVDTDDTTIFPISVVRKDGIIINLTKYGQYSNVDFAKCVIFPTGKTTWEGFKIPFKDGDITVSSLGGIHIMQDSTTSYCHFDRFGFLDKTRTTCVQVERLATEEEKEKLFKSIKDNGYRWDTENKTLEKLIIPRFKVGDRIRSKDFIEQRTIKKCEDDGYWTTKNTWIKISNQDKWELINEPNFKVGDKIKKKGLDIANPIEITEVTPKMYTFRDGSFQYVEIIDKDYVLVSSKFNISILKPFDKVLMRSSNAREWVATFYSHYSNNKFYGCGMCCDQCIPYEGNEHLLGTTDDCDEYFNLIS